MKFLKYVSSILGIICLLVLVPGLVGGESYLLAFLFLILSFVFLLPDIKDYQKEEDIKKRRQ